jgi:hypothetical protein
VAISNTYGKQFSVIRIMIIIDYLKDFRGQKMAERLFQVIVVFFGVRLLFPLIFTFVFANSLLVSLLVI